MNAIPSQERDDEVALPRIAGDVPASDLPYWLEDAIPNSSDKMHGWRRFAVWSAVALFGSVGLTALGVYVYRAGVEIGRALWSTP